MSHPRTTLWQDIRGYVALLAIFIVALLFLGTNTDSQAFISSELAFTDASHSGMEIVPASCASSPYYDGGCSSGGPGPSDDEYVEVYIPPPSIEFEQFINPSSGGGAFSGRLEARPRLVRTGDTTRVYWSVRNAAGCAITGTNGDSWAISSSGTSGQESGPITQQTVFTLTCSGLSGASPASVTQSVTVNIVPVFNEQ